MSFKIILKLNIKTFKKQKISTSYLDSVDSFFCSLSLTVFSPCSTFAAPSCSKVTVVEVEVTGSRGFSAITNAGSDSKPVRTGIRKTLRENDFKDTGTTLQVLEQEKRIGTDLGTAQIFGSRPKCWVGGC